MKKIKSVRAAVLLPGITRVAIEDVFMIVKLRLDDNPRDERDLLQGPDSSFVKARANFLEFCRAENVLPVASSTNATLAAYAGEPEQDCEYDISVDEFSRFARTQGVEVEFTQSTSDLADSDVSRSPASIIPAQSSRNSSGESTRQFQPMPSLNKGKVPLFGVSSCVKTNDKNGGDWGQAFEERFAANEARRVEKRKKARLEKTPPGKVPHTRMGKLVVGVAWKIQVKTGKEATTAQVMTRLVELAGTGEYDWLLEPHIDVERMAAVKWITVKGIKKSLRHGACEKTLLKWKSSLK